MKSTFIIETRKDKNSPFYTDGIQRDAKEALDIHDKNDGLSRIYGGNRQVNYARKELLSGRG